MKVLNRIALALERIANALEARRAAEPPRTVGGYVSPCLVCGSWHAIGIQCPRAVIT